MKANCALEQGFIPQTFTLPPYLACATSSPRGVAAVIAAGAAGPCRGKGQGSGGSESCRCCRAKDPASAAPTLAALLLTGGAAPLIEQYLCLAYACLCRNVRCFQQKLAAISLQRSAWRFITVCLDVFTKTEAMTFFQYCFAGVTVRSSDSRVANKYAHTNLKRKVAGGVLTTIAGGGKQ